MEPNSPKPPEQAPIVTPTPEAQLPVAAEAGASQAQPAEPTAAPAQANPTTPPVAPPSNAQPNTGGIANTASPATADDVDVIEKEWVDAAETIVKHTSSDPHQEEEAVENLQIDYLKQRYGKDVKKAEGNPKSES